VNELRPWVIVRRILVALPLLAWAVGYVLVGLQLWVVRDEDISHASGARIGTFLLLAAVVIVATSIMLIAGRRGLVPWAVIVALDVALLVASFVVAVGDDFLGLWAVLFWPLVVVALLPLGRRIEIAVGRQI
jgi:hypothetical protein